MSDIKNQGNVPKIKKYSKILLTIVASVFVLATCLGFAEILSHIFLPVSTQVAGNLTLPAEKLYFISVAKSRLEEGALTLAGDYQKLGAGGYIWKKDDYFHVVASVYEKENDALLVQQNIKVNHNLDSEIFCVEISSTTLAGEFDSQQKKVLSKSLKVIYSTYLELFDIAVSLDTSVYNEISARLAVNNCYSTLSRTLTDFNTLFPSAEEQAGPLESLRDLLESGEKIMEALCSARLINKGQTYSSLIKYHYTSLLATLHAYTTPA